MSDNNPSLCEIFGVSPEQAYGVFEKECQDAFFEELGRRGIRVKTAEQAEKLCSIGIMLNSADLSSDNSEDSTDLYKYAHQYLQDHLYGSDAVAAARQAEEQEAEWYKAAQDVWDPVYAACGLALRDLKVSQAGQ